MPKTKDGQEPKPERMVRDPKNAIDQVLRRIQAELMPEHALKILAINMYNGEYAMADDMNKALKEFRARWPDDGVYLIRVDGGPAGRL